MSLWAVIPVKPLGLGKSRLMEVLSDRQREKIVLFMLRQTLRELVKIHEINRVIVVSRDARILAIARQNHCDALVEEGEKGLNAALDQATRAALESGVCGIVIIPADLPRLRAKDVKGMLSQAAGCCEMIIAPDYRQEGTNAMLLFPPGMVEYCYGPGSFVLHCKQAKEKGLRLVVYRNESLGFDLDLPEDLDMLIRDNRFDFLNQQERP